MTQAASTKHAAGPVEGRPLDVFITGDDAGAKACVSAFIESPALRPLDAGDLKMAHWLEGARLLMVALIRRALKHGNFSLGINILG